MGDVLSQLHEMLIHGRLCVLQLRDNRLNLSYGQKLLEEQADKTGKAARGRPCLLVWNADYRRHDAPLLRVMAKTR